MTMKNLMVCIAQAAQETRFVQTKLKIEILEMAQMCETVQMLHVSYAVRTTQRE